MLKLKEYTKFNYLSKTGIYKICIGKHIYVGSSSNLKNRLNHHLSALRNNKHHSQFLQNCFNKYTIEETYFDIVEYCEIEILEEREGFYIKDLQADINQILDPVRLEKRPESIEKSRQITLEYYKTHRPVNCKPTYIYAPDGTLYKEFDSAAKAAEFLGITTSAVANSARNKISILRGGYRAKYEQVDKIQPLIHKQVLKQYNTKGGLIKVWDTFYHARHEFNFPENEFRLAIKNKSIYNGYIWKFSDPIKPRSVEPKNGKRVYQYTMDGKYINEYVSASEAERKTNISGISLCARGHAHYKSLGGYRWSYEKVDQLDEYQNNSRFAVNKPIFMFDIFTGTETRFLSKSDVVRKLNPNTINFDSDCAKITPKSIYLNRYLSRLESSKYYILSSRKKIIWDVKNNEIYSNAKIASEKTNLSLRIIKKYCNDDNNLNWRYAVDVAREKLCESGKLFIEDNPNPS